MAPFVATLGCGVFCGAALYISLVQHPALLETGADFGRRFFPPMVVPLTLLWIKPINDRLLGSLEEASETEPLLRRWGARHAVRTVLSGGAFALFLWRLALA